MVATAGSDSKSNSSYPVVGIQTKVLVIITETIKIMIKIEFHQLKLFKNSFYKNEQMKACSV